MPLVLLIGQEVATALIACLLVMAAPADAAAFRNVPVGDTIENATLPTLDGGRASLLRADKKASCFVFFRPDQAHSEKVLGELAAAMQEQAGKPVAWCLVVSDRVDPAAMKTLVASSKLPCPVLIDAGDSLWGKLGVYLHPTAGIVDAQGKLRAAQAFNELRFTPLVVAHVRWVLGEIDDAAHEKIVHPPAPDTSEADEATVSAGRKRNYADTMLKSGKLDRALEIAKESVALQPASADGQALVAAILAAQGNCAGAREAADRALALDAAHARALEVKKGCAGS